MSGDRNGENKVALVTGASSGIGLEVAQRLLELGFSVYAAARRVERMRGLEAQGGKPVALDLMDEGSIAACVGGVLEREGRLDVLVNNAGYGAYGAIEEVPLAEARRQFEVNLFGLARVTQLALPAMRRQRSGHIFNVTSIAGKIYTPMGGWYHATKHAVEGWSDVLRMELEPFGIHVVIIEPGVIGTEWSGIARESLLATSGDGPYREQAQAFGRTLEGARGRAAPSHPRVVADAIEKALRARRRPRTRYAMGSGARAALWGRALLSDRGFDKVIRRMVAK